MNAAREKAAEIDEVELRNAAVAAAVSYVIQSVPGALARFRITPERLADMVRARLP